MFGIRIEMLIRLLIASVIVLGVLTPVHAQEVSSHFKERTLLHTGGPYKNELFSYRLLEPPKVEEGKRYPIILFLHGAGERGTDNKSTLRHFPERMITPERRRDFPCYIVVPQCRPGALWGARSWTAKPELRLKNDASEQLKVAMRALADCVSAFPVDRNRIYLTGMSMGGFGTWELAMRWPGVFAAVAPICGGGPEPDSFRLVGTSLFAAHGDADRVIPVQRSRGMIQALKGYGANPRYNEYPKVGHDSWNQAYGGEDLLKWMFDQELDPKAYVKESDRVFTESAKKLGSEQSVLFFGDSITEYGARPGGFIDRLKKMSEGTQLRIAASGIGGQRVADLAARVDRDVLPKKANIVVLYVGLNDVWQQANLGGSAKQYESELEALARKIQSSGSKLLLVTPGLIGELRRNPHDAQLNAYAQAVRRISTRLSTELVDLRECMPAYSLVVNSIGNPNGVLTTDGVHLSRAGDEFMRALVARMLSQMLSAT